MLERIVVVDSETGGVDPGIHPLISLAAVVLDRGFNVLDTFEVLVNEGDEYAITEESIAIHGITRPQIQARGLDPHLVVAQFHAFLTRFFPKLGGEKVVLAGHNVHFDRGFLVRLYNLADLEFDRFFSRRMIDAASVYGFLAMAGLVPETDLSSEAMFRTLGITSSPRSRHDALTDALATAAALGAMIDMLAQPRDLRALTHSNP